MMERIGQYPQKVVYSYSKHNAMTTLKILGLMSGSSLDGLDLAVCTFELDENETIGKKALTSWQIDAADTLEYTEEWVQKLKTAPTLSGLELMALHHDYGRYIGELCNEFLISVPQKIDYIASHGHTVFHYPDRGFTCQIGAGEVIAAVTGIPTISDFRTKDMALGGQGAPLAPTVDYYLFDEYDFCLNIGGIANVSYRYWSRFTKQYEYISFDIGGANQLLNNLANELGLAYDGEGAIAASGQLNHNLIAQLDKLPYFEENYPKSLGNNWVQVTQWPIVDEARCTTADKLHTVCMHMAVQLQKDLQKVMEDHPLPPQAQAKMLITGGGAYNEFLVYCIAKALQPLDITPVIPDSSIIEYKEALLMALLGALRVQGYDNVLATATGATQNSSSGAISH